MKNLKLAIAFVLFLSISQKANSSIPDIACAIECAVTMAADCAKASSTCYSASETISNSITNCLGGAINTVTKTQTEINQCFNQAETSSLDCNAWNTMISGQQCIANCMHISVQVPNIYCKTSVSGGNSYSYSPQNQRGQTILFAKTLLCILSLMFLMLKH